MEFPGWKFLAVLLLLLGIPFLEFKAGNSLLSFVLGKNCLGGLTWLESAGIFLPQQDFPGWSFVSGNSLVSRCLVASYLGGVSWVEVPCSAPAPSWTSLVGIEGICWLPSFCREIS